MHTSPILPFNRLLNVSAALIVLICFVVWFFLDSTLVAADASSRPSNPLITFAPDAVTAGRPRFVWTPGETAAVRLNLQNPAKTLVERDFQLTFQDDLGRQLWTRAVHVNLPPEASGAAAFDVDTHHLPYGVYILSWVDLTREDGIKGRTLLTLTDDTKIGKARSGEFIYGMDIGGRWDSPNLLDWADWCGVDMIRNCAADPRNFADFKGALTELSRRGIQGTVLMDPVMPWDPDRHKFNQIVADQAAWSRSFATEFKDSPLRWYEIGNEPSIYSFFRGPEPDFVTEYVAMRDAIKSDNPNAFVFLAGLAFQGEPNAGERVEELVKIFPTEKTDAWAYHGHGDGAEAERKALGQLHQLLDNAHIKSKIILETESGTTSTEPVSWRMQARTVVEKLTFAQSTHEMPAFIWFGFHPGWLWGILQTYSQAKPAALAFRVLVTQTRGMIAQGRLDLHGARGEGYWFRPNTPEDKRLTMILWSDYGNYTRTVNLGRGTSNAFVCDMFGNRKPIPVDAGGFVQFTVGLDPIYLVAERSPDSLAPSVLPPSMDLPPVLRVVPGSDAPLDILVHNVKDHAISATITLSPSGNAPIAAAQTLITVPAHGQVPTSLPLHVASQPDDRWPRAWTVFGPIKGNVDLASFATIPQEILSGGQRVLPQTLVEVDNTIDLSVLSGPGYIEKQQALCFAKINADADADLLVGVGADFWMQWYLNRKQVFSTLSEGDLGNGIVSVLNFPMRLHLKKGENLLAVRVLSGSGGWKLASGGPERVQAAQNSLHGTPNSVLLEVRDGSHLVGQESVPVEILRPLERQDVGTPWDHLAPDGVLGNIENNFMKAPDESKWYHGPLDLSGRIWFRATAERGLAIAVAVQDDIATPGDGLSIQIASGSGWKKRLQVTSGDLTVIRRRDEAAKITWYEATIPASKLALKPRQAMAIDVKVRDDDWGALKQTAALVGGGDPSIWYQTWFR